MAVPAQGIERWLAQRLSHPLGAAVPVGESDGSGAGGADGVCANVLFPRPDDLLDEAIAAAGPEHAAAVRAWHPDRSAWVLLDLLDDLLAAPGDGGFELVRHHLRTVERAGQAAGAAAPSPRRYAVARRLAELFAGYAAARPELVRDWAAGRDGSGDGGAGSTIDTPVPDDLGWQPRLWRALRERIGSAPAERLPDVLTGCASDPDADRAAGAA